MKNLSGFVNLANLINLINLIKGIMVGAVLMACAGYADAQANVTSQINISTGFSNAAGLALDLYGNLYVSDSGAGSLSEFAGANGSATALLSSGLSAPGQIAVDTSFNLYVADGTADAVYKYPFSSGSLNLNSPTTLGTGLGKVTGVAVDLSGNVYIVDNTNKQVVKISSGTQTALITGLKDPRQIAVDKYGNVYVADAGSNAVVYLPTGSSTASTVGSGQNSPEGVAVDPTGNVYIADTGNNAVEEVPYSSTTSAPVTASQTNLGVTVSAPTALAVDTRGSVYIAAGGDVIHFNSGAIYFGLQAVNKATQAFPVVFNFTSSVVPATIKVLTQGLTGEDFQDAGSSTCAAGSYSDGQSCTVNVKFKPLFAGARYGAIVFYDSNNNVLLREFIGGGGLGPVLTIDQATLVAPSPTFGSSSTALKVPYSIKPDLFGNLYIADTSNTRIVYGTPVVSNATSTSGATQSLANSSVVLASAGAADDIAINGAGDLYIATTGGVFFYPNLNGTLSTTSTQVSATTNKYRIINVDVAGNAYSCDTGTHELYSLGTTSSAATQILSGIGSAGCVGIAVDLYGNIAISDSTLKGFYYVPANGGSTISQAMSLSTAWGIAFDASGSIYMTDYGVNNFYRIPNEYGTPTYSDVLKMTANKCYSVALDPYGNLFTSTVSSSANYYNMLPRSYPYITQPPLTTTTSSGTMGYALLKAFSSKVADTKTSVAYVTLSNSGTQAPTYSSSSGYELIGDVDDFSVTGSPSSVPSFSTCSFANGLPRGEQCYLPITFSPTSPGVVRSVNISFPSDAQYTSQMTIAGTSSDTAASTASGLAVSVTSPTGSIYPTESVTFTATAASAATGAVTLMVDNVNVASADLSKGSVSFTESSGYAYGSHTVGVTYAGDSTYAEVTTPVTTTISVVKLTPTGTVVTNGTQASVGQTVTLTGTITTQSGYATPTGTLTFYDGSTSIGTATLSSGAGSLSISTMASGTHTITFNYSGDSIYASGSSSNSVSIVVGNYLSSQTAMSVSPTQPTGGYDYGTTLTVTATVSAESTTTKTPTGSVVFNLDGSVTSVALNSSNVASMTVTPNAGSHTLYASYAGDTNFAFSNSSTDSFTTVQATTKTALKTSVTSAYASTPITLTATVSSSSTTPTGTVTFWNGNNSLSTVTLSNGVATLSTQNLPAGTDAVYAVYNGNSNCSGSTSSTIDVAITINSTTLTVSSSPVISYDGRPTLTATIGYTDPTGSSAVPSGTVTFFDNGSVLTTTAVGSGGSASYQPPISSPLSSGIHSITATYSDDDYFATSSTSSSYNIYVAPSSGWQGSYTIAASPSSATVAAGSSATFTITATPTNSYFGYVQYTCSGLPSASSCQMSSDTVEMTGTNTAVSATLTITTTSSGQFSMNRRNNLNNLNKHNNLVELCGLPLLSVLPLLLCGFSRKGRKFLRRIGAGGIVAIVLLSVAVGSMSACGGFSAVQTPKGTYTVTVNATGSGSVDTSTTLQLTVQ